MNLQGQITADLTNLQVKANKSHDGREAFVDLDVSVTQDEAAKRWGEDFADLAFATLRERASEEDDGPAAILFLVDSIKPNRRFVFETHRVDIEEHVINVQPELRAVRMVDGERRVRATLRLPIDVGQTKLLAKLLGKVGREPIKLTFNPQQASLAFVAKEDAAAAHAVQ